MIANLLPHDGIALYHGPVFSAAEADRIFGRLASGLPWRHDEVVMFGKRITTARKVAWFADAGVPYRYSGTVKEASPWDEVMAELKDRTEALTGEPFNSCLANYYAHGGESMGWHSDDEKSLVRHAPVASLSFGAARPFAFRHRETGEKITLTLEHGSLLVMAGEVQERWKHALPKSARIAAPRVNLTFRRMRLPEGS